MVSVSLHEAKAKLSALVRLAETGEEIAITRHGRVVARLVGSGEKGERVPGSGIGTVTYYSDLEFTEEELDEMLNGPVEPD